MEPVLQHLINVADEDEGLSNAGIEISVTRLLQKSHVNAIRRL